RNSYAPPARPPGPRKPGPRRPLGRVPVGRPYTPRAGSQRVPRPRPNGSPLAPRVARTGPDTPLATDGRQQPRQEGGGERVQTECLAMKKVFTTGQVAKICKVAPGTVSKWFDSGRLKGYRIPGSQDRRIPREQLIRFLKEHGMPLGELEEEEWHKVLLIG